MAEKSDNQIHGKWIPVLVAVIGAFGGGFGANYIFVRANPADIEAIARPDPFTGSQGASLEYRLNSLERRVDQLPPRELELAVGLLRHDLDELERRIKRIEDNR